jgi:hypothetical protein
MQGDLPAAAEAVLALRDALLAPAAAAAPSLPPHLSAEQNEQWLAAAAMAAVEADLAAAAVAATAAEAARTISVPEADEAVEKAAPSCQICFEPYGGAVRVRSHCHRLGNRVTESLGGSGVTRTTGRASY